MNKQRPKFNFSGGQKPVTAPEPSTALPIQSAPPTARPPSRRGKRIVGTYVDQDAWMQLRMLNLRTGRSTQDLMLDAIDLLFQQHGLNRIARAGAGAGDE